MKKSKLLSCLALATLASGSLLAPPPSNGQSPASDKTIQVLVQGGVIRVPDDPARVLASNGVVKWVFGTGTSGYVFPNNGITFEYPPPTPLPAGCASAPDPAKVFHGCGPRLNGSTFQCSRGGHAVGACFKYSVKLQPLPGSPSVPDKDPWIMNE